jgi:tetratricopeptide (TPR) repeat protein
MRSEHQEFAHRHAQRGEWSIVSRIANEALRVDNNCVWALHLRGVAAYRRGDHQLSLSDLTRAVGLSPGDPEILNHLGAVAAAAEDWRRARDCFCDAMRLNPASADPPYNLAKVCRVLGDDREAARLFRLAVRLRPTFWEARANLANTLRDLESWDEAVAEFREALSLRPQVARTWNHFGVLHLRRRRYDEAREAFVKALSLQPEHREARFNLGNAWRALGELAEAASCYRAAAAEPEDDKPNGTETDASLELPCMPGLARRGKPDQEALRVANAQLDLANQLRDIGRSSEAIACYYDALRRAPDRVAVWNNLGSCLLGLRQFDEATDCFAKALAISPGDPRAENNLAAMHVASGKLQEGCDRLRRLVARYPDYAEAQSNLGAVLQDLGKFDEGEQHLDIAVSLAPGMADSRWNRALLLLRQSKHAHGWPEYEWRWRRLDFCRTQFRVPPGSALGQPEFATSPVVKRSSSAPQWQGESVDGKMILAFAEQGLGDAIQFVRFLPRIRNRGGCVILEMPRSLVPLMQQSAVADLVIAQGEPVPPHDYQVALMTLPSVLGVTDGEGVSMKQAYLAADERLVRKWRARLDAQFGFRVGIHWQGNPNYYLDRLRSPPLSAFRPLAKLPTVRLISMQHGFGCEQIAVQEPPLPIEAFTGVDQDCGAFMDTAAILAHLDVFVTSDSALAHLAGALNVPTCLVLPHVSDWRWGISGECTPWYPRMCLYRQSRPGDWECVFRRVANDLSKQFGG